MKNRQGMGFMSALFSTTGIIVVLIVALIIFTPVFTGNPIKGEGKLIEKISGMKTIDITSVKTYNDYIQVTKNLNEYIGYVNSELNFEIPRFEKLSKSKFGKVSTVISDYGPLIKNYNSIILSAKNLHSDYSEQNYKDFHKSIGKFSLELAIVSNSLIKWASLEAVGATFSYLSLRCPSCITVISNQINLILTSHAFNIAKEKLDELIDSTEIKLNLEQND